MQLLSRAASPWQPCADAITACLTVQTLPLSAFSGWPLLKPASSKVVCGCRGVLNIVHGTKDVVNNILDHPDIKAVSFVGSNAAGRYISERASANGKRVQVKSQLPVVCSDVHVLNWSCWHLLEVYQLFQQALGAGA